MSSGCVLCDQAVRLCECLSRLEKQTIDHARRARLVSVRQRAMWRFQARWYLHRQVAALTFKEHHGHVPTWDDLMRHVNPDMQHHARYGYQRRADERRRVT